MAKTATYSMGDALDKIPKILKLLAERKNKYIQSKSELMRYLVNKEYERLLQVGGEVRVKKPEQKTGELERVWKERAKEFKERVINAIDVRESKGKYVILKEGGG